MFEVGEVVMFQEKACVIARVAGKMNTSTGIIFKYDLLCADGGHMICGVSDVELTRVE